MTRLAVIVLSVVILLALHMDQVNLAPLVRLWLAAWQ